MAEYDFWTKMVDGTTGHLKVMANSDNLEKIQQNEDKMKKGNRKK